MKNSSATPGTVNPVKNKRRKYPTIKGGAYGRLQVEAVLFLSPSTNHNFYLIVISFGDKYILLLLSLYIPDHLHVRSIQMPYLSGYQMYVDTRTIYARLSRYHN